MVSFKNLFSDCCWFIESAFDFFYINIEFRNLTLINSDDTSLSLGLVWDFYIDRQYHLEMTLFFLTFQFLRLSVLLLYTGWDLWNSFE